MAVSSPRPPHDLQLVLDFVNTLNVEVGSDAIDTPARLGGWLRGRGLLGADEAETIGEADRRRAIELRESLRGLLRAHTRGGQDTEAGATLEHAALAGRLSVGFDPDGEASIVAREPGYAGALARLLVPVARAAADGTWSRVKACDAEDCLEAFYDRSRNRSGRWCDMALCGNRTKVRSYRSKRSG